MLVIDDSNKTVVAYLPDKLLPSSAIGISFEFTNPLYTRIYNVYKSFYNKGLIYLLVDEDIRFKNKRLKIKDSILYSYRKIPLNKREDINIG